MAPSGHDDPAGQGAHADLAGAELNEPGRHAVHTVAPEAAEKEPLAHADCVAWADWLTKKPGALTLQAVAAGRAENEPMAHGSAADMPVVLAK